MVVGTTATGQKIDLGKLTIVKEKEPTGYPSGGPTVPGSSTGIGSTMGRSGGRLSPSQYGTGGYATGSSPTEMKAARERVLAEEKARQEAFNKKGGIVGVGQVSPYFRTGVNDIQTDSQAIKTATSIADKVAKDNVVRTYEGDKGTIIETKQGTYYGVKDSTTYFPWAVGQKEETKYYSKEDYEKVKSGSYPINTKYYSEQEVRQGIVNPQAQAKREAQQQAIQAEESQFKFLGSYFAGGGKEVANIVGGTTVKVISKIGTGVASVTGKVASQTPIVQKTAQTIGGAADNIYKLLSPQAQATVVKVAETTRKAASTPIGQSVVSKGTVLLKTEVTGEALRQAGLYTPEAVKGTYLALTPGRVFTPTKETDVVAGDVYNATRVAYYGGTQNIVDDAGKVIESKSIPGKAGMGEGFAEGFLPGIKVATGFNPEFETQAIEKIKDLPEYKKLSASEKKQYVKEFKDYYLNIGQIGGTIGQVFIETGGEVTGGGRLNVLGPIGSRGGAAVKFGLASGTTGIQEGVYSAELGAKVEQRTLSEQDRLNAAILGGGVAGTFGAIQGATIGLGNKARAVNVIGELADFPGEPLGDVLGGKVKDLIGVPNINVRGSLVKTSYGPDITTSTSTKQKTSTKTKTPSATDKFISDFFLGNQQKQSQQDKINSALGVKTPSINVPGVSTSSDTDIKIDSDTKTDIKDDTKQDDNTGEDTKQDDEQKDETKEDTSTNVPTNVEITSTVPVIAPQGFWLPGFGPIGGGFNTSTRERTKIYNEQAAAARRFNQLSGLPFIGEAPKVKRNKTVIINGKEFKIGKRVKK